eukprot:1054750-Amphidinium_carterae.1
MHAPDEQPRRPTNHLGSSAGMDHRLCATTFHNLMQTLQTARSNTASQGKLNSKLQVRPNGTIHTV